ASELFPEPLTPVKTINLFRGRSRLTLRRLCSRAPRTRIWWLSITRGRSSWWARWKCMSVYERASAGDSRVVADHLSTQSPTNLTRLTRALPAAMMGLSLWCRHHRPGAELCAAGTRLKVG